MNEWNKIYVVLSIIVQQLLLEATTKTVRRKDKTNGKSSMAASNITKDLKNLIDQKLGDSLVTNSNQKSYMDPLNQFFEDERDTTRRLLHLVRSDLENQPLEDLKV